MTDKQLIELYTARNEDAIRETQLQYGSYCKKIAYSILRNTEDAEECLSDVWLKVWNAIPPQKPKYFKGWLATITRNSAITLCRKHMREPAGVSDAALELASEMTDTPEMSVDAQALGEAISKFLAREPLHIRNVFVRRYWYGDSLSEAAAFMGWEEGKTRMILFRTRKKLKDYLVKEEIFHG